MTDVRSVRRQDYHLYKVMFGRVAKAAQKKQLSPISDRYQAALSRERSIPIQQFVCNIAVCCSSE